MLRYNKRYSEQAYLRQFFLSTFFVMRKVHSPVHFISFLPVFFSTWAWNMCWFNTYSCNMFLLNSSIFWFLFSLNMHYKLTGCSVQFNS